MRLTPLLVTLGALTLFASAARGQVAPPFLGAGTSFDRAPFQDLVSGDPTAAFTGVGATGANPSSLSVPLGDQFDLLRPGGHRGQHRIHRCETGWWLRHGSPRTGARLFAAGADSSARRSRRRVLSSRDLRDQQR